MLGRLCQHTTWGDSKTGYGRLYGQECSEALDEFGELVLYHIPNTVRRKPGPKLRCVVFLGRALSSDDAFLGVEGGP